jgi:tRNA U34 5-carboxymethylaminomethyl modifying GTPase MnmE/TrmE
MMIGSMSTKNIVLFGETGAGKSSVVNLMAGEQRAETSPDMTRSTMHWTKYSMTFDGYNYNVFDTIGLEEPQLGIDEYLQAIVNARNLIMKLDEGGGIDLLLFCVRAGRVSATIQNNYRLFYEWLCDKRVPIVIVLTGLEREENMEDWWTRNMATFKKYEIIVQGHACITAADKLDGRHQELYQQSRQLIRDVVKEHTHGRGGAGWKGGEGWFRGFMSRLRVLFLGNSSVKRKDVVSILTKRCGMPQDAAVKLAKEVRKDLKRK